MTRTRLANNLFVGLAGSQVLNPCVTPMFSLDDNNAINVQVTVLSGGSGASNVVANVQGSDDMENWASTGLSSASISINAASAGVVGSGQITGFGYAYGRLVFTLSGTPAATLIAVDLNTYKN